MRAGAGVGAALAAIVATLALLAWPALARAPFYTKGEPREALVVQAMVRGQGLILPLRNGDEIPSKPPLFHWLGALVAVAQNGVQQADSPAATAGRATTDASEAAVRAPSLIAALVVLVVTALTAWRWCDASTAILSAVVLATSVQWLASSVSARVDMVLACTVSLALFAFAYSYERGRPIPRTAYGLVTAAVLAKGPVGAALPIAVVLVFLAVRGELSRLGRSDVYRLGVALAAAGLWYLAAFAAAGDAFVAKQILKENFYRVIDPDSVEAGHVRPLWFYGPLLLAGFAPWSLFLPAFAAVLWPRRQAWRSVRLLLPAVWVGVTVAMFSVAGSKRGVYLLPAYPALALLAGQAWRALTLTPGQAPGGATAEATALGRWSSATLMIGTGLVAMVTTLPVLLVAAHFAGLPVASALDLLLGNVDMQNVPAVLAALDEQTRPLLLWSCASLAILGLTLHAMRRHQWSRAMACVAASVLALATLASGTLLPAMARRRTPEPFLRRVAELVPAGAPLSFYGGFDYAVVFYRGTPIPFRARLSDVPEPDGAWLLTWRASLPALREEAQNLAAGGRAAAAYDVDEVLCDADAEHPDRPSLVLTRIVRRTGDERSDGNRAP